MIGAMADAGVKGSMAGTAMSSTFARLAAPPKEAADALKTLGIETTDAVGNLLPTTDILTDINQAASTLPDADRVGLLTAISGLEGAKGLLNIVSDEGLAKVIALEAKPRAANGEADRVAGAIGDNLPGELRKAGSALGELALVIGEQVEPMVRGMVQGFTDGVVALTDWLCENPELGKWIGRTAVVAGGLVTASGMLLTALFVYDEPVNGTMFLTYVEQVLGPMLQWGDLVVIDNLPAHKGAAILEAIERCGTRLMFLPPYSPDFSPTENAFAKLKAMLRARATGRSTRFGRRLANSLTPSNPTNAATTVPLAGMMQREPNGLYLASGNRFLSEEAVRTHTRLKPYRRLQPCALHRLAASLGEYEIIPKALRSGNGDGTVEALRAHVAVRDERLSDPLRLPETAALQ